MRRDEPIDADAALDEVLAELEGTENYKAWILSLIGPALAGPILEVGAGRGTFSSELRAAGTAMTAVEPSDRLVSALRDRVAGLPDVTVVHGLLADVAATGFGAAVMLNVLEHIEDDAGALNELFARLRPGGAVCLWVPAFAGLYGRFDRQVGHFRRYRRPELIAKVENAGFVLETARYTNLPGFFAWWLVVRVLGSKPTTGGLASLYDRLVVPSTARLENRWAPPFGQSLLVVARRPLA